MITKTRTKLRLERAAKQGVCWVCLKHPPGPSSTVRCESCQVTARKQGRQYHERKWQKVLAGYGHVCTCCGETRRFFLTIDHVNNDGAQERRERGMNTARTLTEILRKNFPPNYQILCMNCNHAKRVC